MIRILSWVASPQHSLPLMAAISLSTIHISPSSLRLLSSYSSQNTPTLSFYSHPKPSFSFSSVSLKPVTTARSRTLTIVSAFGKLSESELIPLPPTPEEITGKFPAESGVYAVYDQSDALQFIGITRSIAGSVLAHRKSVPDLCRSVKVVSWSFALLDFGCVWENFQLIFPDNNFRCFIINVYEPILAFNKFYGEDISV